MIDVNVPQAVVTFGGPGLARNDPDFMAGYIVNHILGGGTFSSRLYREVREKRGLAYGVSDSLVWFRNSAVLIGGTATRADRTGDALAVIESEVRAHGRRRTDGRRTGERQIVPQGLLRPDARHFVENRRTDYCRSSSTISAWTIFSAAAA